MESEANQESENDKFNRVDLLAKDNRDELILIEVQYDSQQDYFQKILYESSKLITKSISKERGFIEIKKIYTININNDKEAVGNDYIYHSKMSFQGLNENDTLVSYEESDIYPEYYLINLNQFNNIVKIG